MIKCPNCGAAIAIDQPGAILRCDYCATQVRVQRRTGFFERVEPPTRLPPSTLALPLVIQAHTRRWVALLLLIPLAIFLFAGGIVAFAVVGTKTTQHAARTAASARASKVEPKWDGIAMPLLADLDGDGVDDLIGRFNVHQPNHQMLIGAISGATGKRLWLSDSLGKRVVSGIMAKSATLALISQGGELHAFELATGKRAWTARFAERPERLCASDADHIVVVLQDETTHRIAIRDGTSATADPPPRCSEPLEHDELRAGRPSLTILKQHGSDGEEAPNSRAFAGMDTRGALLSAGGVRIAYGKKTPGNPTPMLARYEPATGKGKPTLVWTTLVPAIDPLTVSGVEADRGHVGIGTAAIAAAYSLSGGGHNIRVAAFDLETGERRWDVSVPGSMPLSAVVVSDRSVFVSRWTALHAYDIKTGKPQWVAQ